MAFQLPQQRRPLNPIQIPNREIPIDQIIQTMGNNPVAQGITQAGNLISAAIEKRAKTKRNAAQVAAIAKLTGQEVPPDLAGLDADTYLKGLAAKADLTKANKPATPFVIPSVDSEGNITFTNAPTGTKPTAVVKPPTAPKPGQAATTIWQDPASGKLTDKEKPGWTKRNVTETTAATLLSSSYNQQSNRDKPTAATKGSAEFANTIIPHIDELRDLVAQADAKGFIGPGAGRVYGEFMAGKIGSTGDPEADRLLGRLRSTDSLMKTGAMKVHFGSRGGQQMYDHFSDMLNTGKQSAAMLNGSLDGIESFMQAYADAVPNATGHKTLPTLKPNTATKDALRQKLGL